MELSILIENVESKKVKTKTAAETWLEISKKIATEQKEYEKAFRKIGASKKCAKRMARKAIFSKKKIYSSTFHSLIE